MLASPPPTTLEFTDSFPAQHRSLLRDNSSLHVAYSISSDNRWVTAVWTDDWGQVSLKESFCLSRLSPSGGTAGKLQLMQSFDGVCAQVWRRTLEIAKQARINWKVVIVREGGMSKHEVGIWNTLKDNNPSELAGRIQLILACIDLHPPLSVSVLNSGLAAASPVATISTPFPSSVATFSQSSPAAVGNAYGTPVATPLAQANESPDPSGGIMSTPGGTATSENVAEFDPDARWVDASDEVWGIVLNHRVPPCTRSDTEKETRFALASGYLWPMKSNDSHNLVQVSYSLVLLTVGSPSTCG
jgi:mediator of RNA polymerase II transcription subunit 13, fungi type